MSSVEGNRESAAFCADLVRSHDFARYASTLFVPSDQRRALLSSNGYELGSRLIDSTAKKLAGELFASFGAVVGKTVAADV